MRTYDELLPVLSSFGHVLAKFVRVDKSAYDFGTGGLLCTSEIHMICAVDSFDGVGVTELAEQMSVTKGAVSQVVAKLVEKGMLVKEPDPENRARVVVRTTQLGHSASEGHRRFHQEHDQEFLQYLSELDEEAYAVVRELGERMNQWMDNYLE